MKRLASSLDDFIDQDLAAARKLDLIVNLIAAFQAPESRVGISWTGTAVKLRNEQIRAFDAVQLPEFTGTMVQHLKDFAPLHAEVLGTGGLRPIIELGVERARTYGFTERQLVRFYIELLFMLGCDFDTDPQFPWASRILSDALDVDQSTRAHLLYRAAMNYRDSVGGPDGDFAKQALRRARGQPYESAPVLSPDFEREVFASMKAVHLEKWEYLGEAILRNLTTRGKEVARSYSITSDAGVALIIGLMYAMGHGVVTDPKYPWIEQTLTRSAFSDPNKRAERVYSKAMTYLDRVLAHHGS